MNRDAITDLILEVFRLNGALLAAGDRLVGDLGLSSARWQTLGAIAFQPSPAPVVRLAEAMGLTRQSVQRIVDDFVAEGLAAFADNPHHKRAKLVLLTDKGRALFEAAQARQAPWAEWLGADVSNDDVARATRALAGLRARLADGENR